MIENNRAGATPRAMAPVAARRSPDASVALTALFALSIAGYPLISALPLLLDLPSRLFSVPLRAMTLLLSVAMVFSFLLGYRRSYSGAFWIPLLGFWFLYSIRLLWDTQMYPVSLAFQPYEYLLFAYGICFIPMLAFMVQTQPDSMRRVGKYTMLVSCLAAAVAVWAISLRISGGMFVAPDEGRLQSEVLDPISLGHISATVVILGVYHMLGHHTEHRQRMFYGATAIIGLVGVAMASARGPVLAMSVACLAAVIWTASHATMLRRLLAVALIAPLVAGLFHYFESEFGFRIVSGLESLYDLDSDASGSIRKDSMWDAWTQFEDNAMFGSRLEEINTRYYPHNVAVEAFMSTGIVGGGLFLVLMAWSAVSAMRLVIADRGSGWVGLLYLQYVIGAMFSGAIFFSYTMWALIAAAVSASSALRGTQNSADP